MSYEGKPGRQRIVLKRRRVLSLIITALIIAVLLYPSQVRSLTVQITGLKGQSIVQGTTFTFYIDLKLDTSELVPIRRVKITVEGPTSFTYIFPITGGQQYYLKLEPYQSIINQVSYSFGYGYGYGYFYGYGYGYLPNVPPYGYGYGYYPPGYGYGFLGSQILRWKATLINTGALPVGEYKIRAEIESDGIWWGGAPTEVNFFIVAPPPPPPVPIAEEIETAPLEEAIEIILELSPEEAASVLVEVSTERVTEILVEIPTETAAEIVEELPTEKVVEVIETGVEMGLTEDLANVTVEVSPEVIAPVLLEVEVESSAALLDVMVEVNVTSSAVIVEEMLEVSLPETIEVLEEVSTESLVSLIIEITGLPATPETAAKILENMSLEKAVEATKVIILLDFVEELGKIFVHLSTERLNDIFEALTIQERTNLMPYLTAETVARIRTTLLPLPDLTLTSITVAPTEPLVQETVTVKITVKNAGNVKASGILVELKADGVPVQTSTVREIEAGKSTIVTFTWKPAEAGTYTLRAMVDPDDKIEELNEENNVISTTVTVKPKKLPDLTVQFEAVPEELEINKEHAINLLIKNIGEADSAAFAVELTVDGVSLGRKEIEGLAAGSSTTVTFTWKPTKAGDYTLKATVDPDNRIEELNEENNVATVSVKVPEIVPPIPWAMIIAAVIIIIVIIIVAYLVLKRRG